MRVEALSNKTLCDHIKGSHEKERMKVTKQPTITSAFTAYIAKANFIFLVCFLLSYFPSSLMYTLIPVFLEENKANTFPYSFNLAFTCD